MSEASETKCRHKGCGNRIKSNAPIRYCYLHEHEQLAVTPKGQHGLRRTNGPASWQERLRKENKYSIPQNSAGIDGYPFFTTEDLSNHVQYIQGDERYRPTPENVLDRYPIQTSIVLGKQISGSEISVIDGNGNMHVIDQNSDVAYVDGMRAFSVDNAEKFLSISDDERYQIITIDNEAIAERYGLQLESQAG